MSDGNIGESIRALFNDRLQLIDTHIKEITISLDKLHFIVSDVMKEELERQNELLIEMQKCVVEIEKDIILLKFKAGIWGAIGAAIPICLAILLFMMRKVIIP